MIDKDWPFDQPRNCAVIALRSIVLEGEPILRIYHDEEDHGWQFLGLKYADPADAALVALEEIVNLDPTVREVASLPPGWHAWRASKSDPWNCSPGEDVQ